jgi:hypothetical protein
MALARSSILNGTGSLFSTTELGFLGLDDFRFLLLASSVTVCVARYSSISLSLGAVARLSCIVRPLFVCRSYISQLSRLSFIYTRTSLRRSVMVRAFEGFWIIENSDVSRIRKRRRRTSSCRALPGIACLACIPAIYTPKISPARYK